METNQYDLVDALDSIIKARRPKQPRTKTKLDSPDTTTRNSPIGDFAEYHTQRAEVMAREAALSWDYDCKQSASDDEARANLILQAIRKLDDQNVYATQPTRRGYRGQEHPRFMGDHFLYNADLIEQTMLYRVAQKMPKGAHLHIHFNANLLPSVLIDIAKRMDRMFITSNVPLIPIGETETEPGYYDHFDRSKIQFSILSKENALNQTGNLFDRDYPVDKRLAMEFKDFREEFGKHYKKCTVDEWLINKLVFHEEEAHGWLQTAEGAWERFNARTQMMKGLFNYETAYREYTRQCLWEFVDDNIQYAEIRPNFMTTNQLWKDDGTDKIPNEGIMKIIIEEYEAFQRELHKQNKYFGGLKVIYCTPRSFSNALVKMSLDECFAFKKRWPEWIAGECHPYSLLTITSD
jgi:adenosine deaminase CECR1